MDTRGSCKIRAVADEGQQIAWMPHATRKRRPALAVALFFMALVAVLAMATATRAAEPGGPAPTTATPQATQQEALDELDEVVVKGRRLKDEIVEAEDEFYKLFNDLNKDDRYDTHCVYLQMDRDSRLQSRACIPGFVGDAIADWAPYKARCQPPQDTMGSDEFSCLDRNKDGRLSLDEAGARVELAAAFSDLDKDGGADGYLNLQEFNATCSDCMPELLPAPDAIYMPPTPDAVLMNGTAKWQAHLTEVVNGDPRLHKMAAHLGDLYFELAKAQRRFDELDAEVKSKAAKRNTGPRVH